MSLVTYLLETPSRISKSWTFIYYNSGLYIKVGSCNKEVNYEFMNRYGP